MPLRSAYVAAQSGVGSPTAATSWPSRRIAGIIRVAATSLAPISPQRSAGMVFLLEVVGERVRVDGRRGRLRRPGPRA